MRARPYRLAPAAVEDLEAIADYLNERDPVAAVRFVEAAEATFEQLGFAPAALRKGADSVQTPSTNQPTSCSRSVRLRNLPVAPRGI
jgi:plasmid stabilization system protein ParE